MQSIEVYLTATCLGVHIQANQGEGVIPDAAIYTVAIHCHPPDRLRRQDLAFHLMQLLSFDQRRHAARCR